ncbi:kelch-like protein 41b [Drosophila albomicans]|uniref:Kelch-like protein 41b n=1 Tax=Drosophila albomicans TaxID=7291 RepID=A0A9C6SQV2_DROAB|nr:kelch-like protein 41b [Drosophila albomicans]XP_051860335.1 kelch-like protein 41b [Drosophila albomicans]XP_051860336.1 kelch-like protein 41b [Drosophila albomicans]
MNWLGKSLTAILDSDRNTDCKFIIDDNVYLGHKLIFSCASEVFERMCYGNFTEGTTGEIKLTDVEPETFVMFRNFIYSGDSQIKCDDVEQIIKLLEFGHKYLVSSIKDACVDKLKKCSDRCILNELLAIYQCSHILSINSLLLKVSQHIQVQAWNIKNLTNILHFQVHPFKSLIRLININESMRFKLIEEYIHVNDLDAININGIKDTLDVKPEIQSDKEVGDLIDIKKMTLDEKVANAKPEVDSDEATTSNGSIVKEFLDLISFEKFTLEDFYNGPGKSKLLDFQRKYELIYVIAKAQKKSYDDSIKQNQQRASYQYGGYNYH